jgi:hypothetical protein
MVKIMVLLAEVVRLVLQLAEVVLLLVEVVEVAKLAAVEFVCGGADVNDNPSFLHRALLGFEDVFGSARQDRETRLEILSEMQRDKHESLNGG